jgi:hypothetical protein
MEGGIKLSSPRLRQTSTKPVRNAKADVLNTVSRLGKKGLKAFFGNTEAPVLPTQRPQTPKLSAKKPTRLLGGAAKPAAAKPASTKKASPVKPPSAKKESVVEKIKRLAAERIAQNKAMEMDVVEEPRSPPKNNASLKTLKWPGTVAVARARGVSEEVIASMKGNARSLKLYLAAH